MSIDSAPAEGSPPEEAVVSVVVSVAPLSLRWRRAALLLVGAAQLITISALLSADPITVGWSSLLLATAPAPLAALAEFGPAPVNLLAAVAGLAVLVTGVVAQVTHTGLFFVPALVVLAVGMVKLWREQSAARGRGARA